MARGDYRAAVALPVVMSLVVAPLAMMPVGSGHVSSEKGSVVGMKMGRKIKENVKKEKKIEEK